MQTNLTRCRNRVQRPVATVPRKKYQCIRSISANPLATHLGVVGVKNLPSKPATRSPPDCVVVAFIRDEPEGTKVEMRLPTRYGDDCLPIMADNSTRIWSEFEIASHAMWARDRGGTMKSSRGCRGRIRSSLHHFVAFQQAPFCGLACELRLPAAGYLP